VNAALHAAGGGVFALLGLVHVAYTLADLAQPRRLVPTDPAVIAAMRASGVRLAGRATTMWRAWIGFNLSHGLGAIVFGAATALWGTRLTGAAAWLPAVVAALYLAIGWRCWFRVPNAGIALATLLFVAAAVVPTAN
jgi:hypothetical protein